MMNAEARLAMTLLGLSHTELRERISALTKKPISKTVAANWFHRAKKYNRPVPDFVTIFLWLTMEMNGVVADYLDNVAAGMADE